jgi:glycosyltransferase involved in cell wall biosynthesis
MAMVCSVVQLKGCFLNLGEIHKMLDHGYFHPVFNCVTEQGEEFTAKMRLHITEPLDKLVIVDPRQYPDGGYEANSVGSKILSRKSSYQDNVNPDAVVVNPQALSDKKLFTIEKEEIKKALLQGYNIENENSKIKILASVPQIAFTCHDPNTLGGGNTILFRLINWLADLGVKVSVYSCGSNPKWLRVNARFCNFDSYAEMANAIEEEVVVVYSMWHIEPILKANIRGKRIYHIRQIYEPYHYGSNYESMIARKPVIDLLESLPLGVITISPHLKDWYKNLHHQNSHLITNGICLSGFYPITQERSAKAAKQIVSVGDPIHFVKGCNVLYDALSILAHKKPQLQLRWTIATGTKRVLPFSVQSIPRNLKIELAVGLNEQLMRSLYHSADVVVNPSLYEGFGLPSLEAMACGAPVVHADNHGLDFIVEHEKNCLVVPVNDAKAMAQALERVITDASLREQLCKGGFATAREHSTLHQFKMFRVEAEKILHTAFANERVESIQARLQQTLEEHTVSPQERPTPLVSVVIPSYNQAEYLREALDSLLAQTYTHWEAVVVNDGSTDNTEAVMHEYASRDLRIRPITKVNGGITSALNEGLDHARGEFFCWLSSDDLFYPTKLELQINAFKSLNDMYALVFGSFDLLQDETHAVDVQPFAEPLTPGAEFPEALRFDFIDGCTIMIRMDVMREVGGFNPYYRHSQDMELWVRIASRGYRFQLLNSKLTIRRIHVAQSSTGNMIHCRYDAAWMMNYYITHFHLLEMYRYFNLKDENDLSLFVEHLITRMTHTEANVNHPLLQKRFWDWIENGLAALKPALQQVVLERCLRTLLKYEKLTSKMEYYIGRCSEALLKQHECKPFYPMCSVEGRDIRQDTRATDEFGSELFQYGVNLLVNAHTPLFAQELYFHNTNKVVDTPYKLSHSAFRYLSQFNNLFRSTVMPFADMNFIPQSDQEALKLFCCLTFSQWLDAMYTSMQFHYGYYVPLEEIEAAEQTISNLPAEPLNILRTVCGQRPTLMVLHYWNALTLEKEGRIAEAYDEAVKVFTNEHQLWNGRIAFKLLQWSAIVGETAMVPVLKAYLSKHSRTSGNLKLLREHKKNSNAACIKLLPKPIQFLRKENKSSHAAPPIEAVRFIPVSDSRYALNIKLLSTTGKFFYAQAEFNYVAGLDMFEALDPFTNDRYAVSIQDIYRCWSAGYDFQKASEEYAVNVLENKERRSIAFTMMNSSVSGGGPMIVFRYANWLADLGVDVRIYTNDKAPTWMDVNATFVVVNDDAERYAAITEPIVIVYSILEVPQVLRYVKKDDKTIYHLCQGLEDFNYGYVDAKTLLASKPIFEVMNSLPVGRLAVSEHVRQQYQKVYDQDAYFIPNGVDLQIHRRRAKRNVGKKINVLAIGNPYRVLKGIPDIKQALAIFKRQHQDVGLSLLIASGEQVFVNHDFDTTDLGFTTTVLSKLNQRQVHELYLAADVFVNAAWYEGFGLPTVEAMATRVPVVQADNRGLDGVVHHEENCLLVPPQNPDAIASALARILSDDELRDRLIENGSLTAQRYSLKHQFEPFQKAFEAILCCRFDAAQVSAIITKLTGQDYKSLLEKADRHLMPLFSILVPTYNQAKYLSAALDSLIAQTYVKWEAIVVNDGSNDETAHVMERYATKDFRIRVFHKQNGGVSSALNEALRYARGEWVCWLSSDDLFAPDKLQIHLNAIRSNPQIKFYHTHYSMLDERTGKIHEKDSNLVQVLPSKPIKLLTFFFSNYINGISVCVHRSVFEEVGTFREDLKDGQDFDMWMRISAKHESKFINSRTAITRLHPQQGTMQFSDAGIFDSARASVDFLNRHPYETLFPFLDLSVRANVVTAIEKTLVVVSDTKSFINRIGAGQALLARMIEWLSSIVSTSWKNELFPDLKRVAMQIQKTNVSSNVRNAFKVLSAWDGNSFVYQPHNPLDCAYRYSEIVAAEGNTAEAESLEKYLSVRHYEPSDMIPQDFNEAFDRVCGLIQRKEPAKALMLLTRVESMWKTNPPESNEQEQTYLLKGSLLLQQGELEDAKNAFESALTANPNSSEACCGLGEVFYQAEFIEKAKTMFEWAVKNNPSSAAAVKGLARVNQQLGLPADHSSLEEQTMESEGIVS